MSWFCYNCFICPWCVFSLLASSVSLYTLVIIKYPQLSPQKSPFIVAVFESGSKQGSHITLGYGSWISINLESVSSVTQSCPTLCDPMNRSMPGLPVHHQIPEFTQTHVHQISEAIQPSHPLSSPSPPAPSPSQHQGLFQWVNSLHEVAKVLEFQPQHQSLQWTPRTDLL